MRSLLVLLAAMAAGCGASPSSLSDGGPDAQVPAITRVLTFSPSGMQQLQPGAQLEIAVLLSDRMGQPVAGQDVRFALVGDVHDATLSVTHAMTGSSGTDAGVAHVTLLAPTVAATLSVRASADGAADARLDVAVSARGFGSLAATTTYDGARGPNSLVLELFEETDCQHLDMLDPVRSATLPAAGGVATFAGLPAGVSFTVRGSAIGPMSTPLAQGCVDSIEVVGDQTVSTFVSFEDIGLRAGGAYTVTVDLDLGPTPTLAAARWEGAVMDFALAHGGAVPFILATIGDAVRTESSADYSTYESALPHLTSAVQSDLDHRGADPLVVLSQFATDTAMVVQSPTLALDLDVTPASGSQTNVMTLSVRSTTVTLDPLTPDVHVDDAVVHPAATGNGAIAISVGDRASVTLRGTTLPFAMLSRAAADALLARLGVASTHEWLATEVDCAHLATLVTPYTGGCDATCVTNACDSALQQFAQAFDQSMAEAGSMNVLADMGFEGPITGVPGGLRLASAGPAPLLGAYEYDPAAILLGMATMRAQ